MAEETKSPQSDSSAPSGRVIRFVRLAGPLAGQYCHFSTGEKVKVTTNGNGLATVERAKWRNSLTICNVLYGVLAHLVCEITEDEPNDPDQATLAKKPQDSKS